MNLRGIAGSPSKTLSWILAFFCLGILVGPLFISLASLPFLLVALVCVISSLWLPAEKRLILIGIACVLFGIFRYQQSLVPDYLVTVQDKTGASVRVEGVIGADVERRANMQQTVLSDVQVVDEAVFGRLLVRFPLYPKLAFGDHVVFSCRLESPEPFEGFAYDRQLAARGILAVCPFPEFVSVKSHEQTGLLARTLLVRDYLIGRLRLAVPEPHASFISGLLFGGSSSLSLNMREDFSRTGTSHILAASGFNVSLFSVLLLHWILQSPLGRRRGLFVTTILLFLYVITAGATPAVVRAGLMAGMLIVQSAIRRQASVRNILLSALSLMLIVNPRLLLDDVGFQLSFAATVALIYILPLVENRFNFIPEVMGLRTSVAASCVAIVCTLPLLLWHFGQLSLIAPIANALVLPFVPLLMLFGMIALVGGTFLALPAYGLSFVLLRIIQVLSSIPLATLSLSSSRLFAVLSLGLLCIWLFYRLHVLSSPRSAT